MSLNSLYGYRIKKPEKPTAVKDETKPKLTEEESQIVSLYERIPEKKHLNDLLNHMANLESTIRYLNAPLNSYLPGKLSGAIKLSPKRQVCHKLDETCSNLYFSYAFQVSRNDESFISELEKAVANYFSTLFKGVQNLSGNAFYLSSFNFDSLLPPLSFMFDEDFKHSIRILRAYHDSVIITFRIELNGSFEGLKKSFEEDIAEYVAGLESLVDTAVEVDKRVNSDKVYLKLYSQVLTFKRSLETTKVKLEQAESHKVGIEADIVEDFLNRLVPSKRLALATVKDSRNLFSKPAKNKFLSKMLSTELPLEKKDFIQLFSKYFHIKLGNEPVKKATDPWEDPVPQYGQYATSVEPDSPIRRAVRRGGSSFVHPSYTEAMSFENMQNQEMRVHMQQLEAEAIASAMLNVSQQVTSGTYTSIIPE